jgi:hypothetical protein
MSALQHLAFVLLFVLGLGCHPQDGVPVDLTERLGPGEVRAGVITDETALFGGISAEGAAGDLLIYNDRVRFVIQGVREGNYYASQSGGVIDADVVRPDGELGHDAIDEWAGMYGFGRLLDATTVSVVDDGFVGGRAIVHVEGHESPMELLTGSVGSTTILPDLGLDLAVDYVLEPDSNLLEVRSTMTATTGDATMQPGDVLMGALEVVEPWDPGVGLDAPGDHKAFTGFVGRRNELAMAIVARPGTELTPSNLDVLSAAVQLAVGMGEPVTIPAGQSATFDRYYAVADDLATITDAMLAAEGAATDAVSGTVTAPDGPVAGARVDILVDGAPYTLAISRADGSFAAEVPAGSSTSVLADGRGYGEFLDLPDGVTSYAPYAAGPVRAATLAAFESGALPRAAAAGRGTGTADAPLVLGEPGYLVVRCADGLPFEARVAFAEGDPAVVDERLVQERPSGYAAIAWARDGEVRFPVEPGHYALVAQRGIRYELDHADVTVAPGEDVTVDIELPEAYHLDDWLLGDPHMHSSPSGDTEIPMEDRLIGAAAAGLQLHFGTDHDHIADYRPLLGPLGLDDVLQSVLSDEMSPVLRGHINIYPVSTIPAEPNGGAWLWWETVNQVPDTTTQLEVLRERHGDFVMQMNHPTDKGVAESAHWDVGHIGNADKWATDFDAIEALNAKDYDIYLPFFWDVYSRGMIATAVGVSDAHGHIDHGIGASSTFFGMGTSDVHDYTDDGLREAMHAGRTVVTRGPFIALSIDPGTQLTGSATLTADAMSPSWIHVDRLILVRDGAPVDTVEGTHATFTLDPEVDAAYSVVAEGDTAMELHGSTPWAMTSPIRVDVAGDGWTPPRPPLTIDP